MIPRFMMMLGIQIPYLSEFFDNLLKSILNHLYSGLYAKADEVFGILFNALNEKVVWASEELTANPRDWNNSAFQLTKGIAENALIPIAACIIAFIFCWELIRMMQENNHMHNIRPDTILMVLLKLALCMLACSKSFTIVMGFFDIGVEATQSVIGESTVERFGAGLEFGDVLPQVEDAAFGDVLDALIAVLLLFVAWILTLAVGAIIYIRINIWFIELLMYASASPIPFATFGNKEWGQVGTNYTRKMLALSFEGFFMLMAFAMFGAVMGGIGNGNNFYESVVMIIAAAFALCMLLFKAGNISASVFNAH